MREAFRGPLPRVKIYQTQDEANQDLAAGRIDATQADSIALDAFLASEAGAACCELKGAVADDPAILGRAWARAVRKGDTELEGQDQRGHRQRTAPTTRSPRPTSPRRSTAADSVTPGGATATGRRFPPRWGRERVGGQPLTVAPHPHLRGRGAADLLAPKPRPYLGQGMIAAGLMASTLDLLAWAPPGWGATCCRAGESR
jgi:hypothetical protein